MKVLVTGASGFIGRNIVKRLVRERRNVVYVTTRDDRSVPEGCQAVPCDLSSIDPQNLPRVDGIIHAAQSRHYRDFPAQANDIFAVNVGSTQALLDYACKTGVKYFCYLSSGSVYEPYGRSLEEDSALSPTSANGLTKLSGEFIAKSYADHMCVSIPRIFFPYGPGQVERLVPGLVDRIRRGEPIFLSGDNGFKFAPTYVDDVSEIIVGSFYEMWSGVYNLASPQIVSMRTMADEIANALACEALYVTGQSAQPDIVPPVHDVRIDSILPSFTSLKSGIIQTIRGL